MTPAPDRRSIGFGPVRLQRITSTIYAPALIILVFWEELRILGRAAVIVLSAFGAYRAFRMGIEKRSGSLIIRGFLTSTTVDMSEIESVQFLRSRAQAMYRLVLKRRSDGYIVADGVSTRRRAFPEISPDPTRDEKRASQRIQSFFQGTQISYLPPAS